MDKPKSYNDWHSSLQGFEGLRHANCCKISYEAGQQSRQAEVDELQEEYAETELYLRGQLTDRDSKIANLEYLLEQDKSLIPTLNKKLEEKDKRIEVALERLGLAIEAEKDWAIIEAVKILRGEHG